MAVAAKILPLFLLWLSLDSALADRELFTHDCTGTIHVLGSTPAALRFSAPGILGQGNLVDTLWSKFKSRLQCQCGPSGMNEDEFARKYLVEGFLNAMMGGMFTDNEGKGDFSDTCTTKYSIFDMFQDLGLTGYSFKLPATCTYAAYKAEGCSVKISPLEGMPDLHAVAAIKQCPSSTYVLPYISLVLVGAMADEIAMPCSNTTTCSTHKGMVCKDMSSVFPFGLDLFHTLGRQVLPSYFNSGFLSAMKYVGLYDGADTVSDNCFNFATLISDLRSFITSYFPGKTFSADSLSSTWDFCIPDPALFSLSEYAYDVRSGYISERIPDIFQSAVHKMWGCNATDSLTPQKTCAYFEPVCDTWSIYSYNRVGNSYVPEYRFDGSCPSPLGSNVAVAINRNKCTSMEEATSFCSGNLARRTTTFNFSQACRLQQTCTNYNGRYINYPCANTDILLTGEANASDRWYVLDYNNATNQLGQFCQACVFQGYPNQCSNHTLSLNISLEFVNGIPPCKASQQTNSSTTLYCNYNETWNGFLSGGVQIFETARLSGSFFGPPPPIYTGIDDKTFVVPVMEWTCDFSLAIRLNTKISMVLEMPELRKVFDAASDKLMLMQTCRAKNRATPFNFTTTDFLERFAVYTPFMWLAGLMPTANSDVYDMLNGNFATVATWLNLKSLFSSFQISPLATCNSDQYAAQGCFIRYTGLNTLLGITSSATPINALLGITQCTASGAGVPPPSIGLALEGAGAMNMFNIVQCSKDQDCAPSICSKDDGTDIAKWITSSMGGNSPWDLFELAIIGLPPDDGYNGTCRSLADHGQNFFASDVLSWFTAPVPFQANSFRLCSPSYDLNAVIDSAGSLVSSVGSSSSNSTGNRGVYAITGLSTYAGVVMLGNVINVVSPSATVCNAGYHINTNSTLGGVGSCLPCPSGTCQNVSGATFCIDCDPTDIFCGGPICSSVSNVPFNGSSSSMSMAIPIAPREFTGSVRSQYLFLMWDAFAHVFNKTVSPDWIRILSVSAGSRRLLASTNLALEMKINPEQCGNLPLLLQQTGLFQHISSAGLPAPSTVDVAYTGCPTKTQLSPQLAAQATATTAVVAGVVAAIISTSVAGSVAGSMGGAMAAGASGGGGGAGGASVYQLIGATQFMNIFGSVMDTSPLGTSPAPKISRRLGSRSITLNNATNGTTVIKNAVQISAATSFSKSFGWSNFRFDDIFQLKPGTCGGRYLVPFFGIFGTFLAALFGSFALRSALDIAMKRFTAKVSGDYPDRSLPGFRLGQYEFHVVKTAHLGLCQAAGSLLSVAYNKGPGCSCGWFVPAVWALAIIWLICLPIGFIGFTAIRILNAAKRHQIMFYKVKGAGSWTVYFNKIIRARASGSAEGFCKPTVIHVIIRSGLGVGSGVCIFLGLRAATAQVALDAVVLFVAGTILAFFATYLSSKIGRRIVVALTNLLASSINKKFIILEEGAVQEVARTDRLIQRGRTSIGAWILSRFGKLQVMLEAASDSMNLKLLRQRGRWLKKDSMKMFYMEYHQQGFLLSLFWMVKNVLIGVLLTAEPVLVEPLSKTWVITGLYAAEVIIQTFFSPDIDVFNGAKLAFQAILQFIIIFIGALTVSNVIATDTGSDVTIQLSIIQVSLAIPEQLWGLLKNTILKKKGPPKEPDFKMTMEELAMQQQINDTGIAERYAAAREAIVKIRTLIPYMKRGDIKGLVLKIITDKELILDLNKVKPGCLIPLFHEVFCCEPIYAGLNELAEVLPVISPPFKALAENPWETNVQFQDGVDNIFDIGDITKCISDMAKSISKAEFVNVIQDMVSCAPLLRCLSKMHEDEEPSSIPILNTLQQLFEEPTVQEAIVAAISSSKDPHTKQKLEILQNIAIEKDEDVEQLFLALEYIFSDGPKHSKEAKKSKESTNPQKAKRKLSVSNTIFAKLNLHDAINILQQFSEQIPEPGYTILLEGLEQVAIFLDLKKIIDRVRDFDFPGAIEVLLFSPNIIKEIELLSPGAIYPVVKTILLSPTVAAAISECSKTKPELADTMESLLNNNMETSADLEDFQRVLHDLVPSQEEGQQGFSFVDEIIAKIDDQIAITAIQQFGQQLPEQPRGFLELVLQALELAPTAKRMRHCVKAREWAGAIKELVSPSFIQAIDKIAPGAIYPVLKCIFGLPAITKAISDCKELVPQMVPQLERLQNIGFESPADIMKFTSIMEEMASPTDTDGEQPCFSLDKDVIQKVDMDSVLVVFKQFIKHTPEPARRIFKSFLDDEQHDDRKASATKSSTPGRLHSPGSKQKNVRSSVKPLQPIANEKDLSVVTSGEAGKDFRFELSSSVVILETGNSNSFRAAQVERPTSHQSLIKATNSAKTASGKHTFSKGDFEFLKVFVRILENFDPEQSVAIIERIEEAIPEPAQLVTEDGFDALYEVVGAAVEMKNTIHELEESKTADNGDLEAAQAKDSPVERKSTGSEGLLQTLRAEPEWIVFGLIWFLGLATVAIFATLANSNDCGCDCAAAS